MLFRGLLGVLVFLVCVTVCARSNSRGLRQWTLLSTSYIFYLEWSGWLAIILAFSTAMNFLLGKQLRRKPEPRWLAIGILLNVLLLAVFKYLPEVAVSLPGTSLQFLSHLALPLGISFWTFQAMSYLFDLYREEDLDPSLAEFALYMAFFPVVVSGPICRVPDMLPQYRSLQRTPMDAILRGIARIATGIFMMQIAKLLGQGILSGDGINSGFDQAANWSGPDVWCLAFGYGLQLFLDFAGYSHIAIGAAQAMGFAVPENFSRPFQSTTPSVFWTRWHMSLSFWIRDYVFLPLATWRREAWWRNVALVLSMTIFGVWHRASLLFVIWGLYHGLLLVVHRRIQSLERNIDWQSGPYWKPLSWLTTMATINLGWLFFRAKSFAVVKQMFTGLFAFGTYNRHYLSSSLYLLVVSVAVSYALVVLMNDKLRDAHSPAIRLISQSRWWWLPPIYVCALLIVYTITHTRSIDAAQLMYRNF